MITKQLATNIQLQTSALFSHSKAHFRKRFESLIVTSTPPQVIHNWFLKIMNIIINQFPF